jgi:hypothetical protein
MGLELADRSHGVIDPLASRPEDAFVEPNGLVLAGTLGRGQVHVLKVEPLREGTGHGQL